MSFYSVILFRPLSSFFTHLTLCSIYPIYLWNSTFARSLCPHVASPSPLVSTPEIYLTLDFLGSLLHPTRTLTVYLPFLSILVTD